MFLDAFLVIFLMLLFQWCKTFKSFEFVASHQVIDANLPILRCLSAVQAKHMRVQRLPVPRPLLVASGVIRKLS